MPIDNKTFVLVPGAWLGAWSWHPTAKLLQGRGHRVVALTLPGLSYEGGPRAEPRLSSAVDFVVDEVRRRDLRDVVLVGHSWGGYPVTGAMRRLGDRVARIVYYNAVVPAPGLSMADENPEYGRAIREAIAASPDGTVPIPFEAVRTGLMHDEPPDLQRLAFELMVPQPGAYMTDVLDGAEDPTAGPPAAYLLGETDVSLARPGAEFAARLGVEPTTIPRSHMAMLTRPAEVARALTDVPSDAETSP